MDQAAQAALVMPEDPDAAADAQAALVWNLGATGKLCWPIPDRGLHKQALAPHHRSDADRVG